MQPNRRRLSAQGLAALGTIYGQHGGVVADPCTAVRTGTRLPQNMHTEKMAENPHSLVSEATAEVHFA